MSNQRSGSSYSKPINVSVGVCVLSPFLFIIVMQALSCEFRAEYSWELLRANDPVIVAESLELKCLLKLWKNGFELKGLKVNVEKVCSSLESQKSVS